MISVTFDTAQLDELMLVLKDLGKQNLAPNVICRAVNRTAREARTQIARTLRDSSGLKYGNVLNRIRIDDATPEKPFAAMSISHKRVPLIEFRASQKAKGVQFKTSPKGAWQMVQSAFITTGKGGVEGVFIRRRADYKSHKQTKKERLYENDRDKAAWEDRQRFSKVSRVPRYPLDFLRGPSLWRMFSGFENLAGDEIKKARQNMTKHVWEQVDLIFKRRKGAVAA